MLLHIFALGLVFSICFSKTYFENYLGGDCIFDYGLDELLQLLSNLDESQIKESRHFIESNVFRNDDIGMIYDLLLTKKPVQVGKTNRGTFKIVYEHPTKNLKIYI